MIEKEKESHKKQHDEICRCVWLKDQDTSNLYNQDDSQERHIELYEVEVYRKHRGEEKDNMHTRR